MPVLTVTPSGNSLTTDLAIFYYCVHPYCRVYCDKLITQESIAQKMITQELCIVGFRASVLLTVPTIDSLPCTSTHYAIETVDSLPGCDNSSSNHLLIGCS